MARSPIHPGVHLAEELGELGMSAAELSRQLDVPVNRITAIINGQRGITADTALRLGHWFGSSPGILAQFAEDLRTASGAAGGGRSREEAADARSQLIWTFVWPCRSWRTGPINSSKPSIG
ncbi:addiction module HigA family antidote [Bradyrhizobium sp. USDA 4353]